MFVKLVLTVCRIEALPYWHFGSMVLEGESGHPRRQGDHSVVR